MYAQLNRSMGSIPPPPASQHSRYSQAREVCGILLYFCMTQGGILVCQADMVSL